MKMFDELRFSDDFMFGKVMEDMELCRDVLEVLLQRHVGKLTEIQTQKEFILINVNSCRYIRRITSERKDSIN